MKKLLIIGTACAAIFAGCSNQNGLGLNGGAGAGGTGQFDQFGNPINGTIGQNGLGAAGDPSSIAYFNETIGDTVLFQVDQSTLTDEARSLLNRQAQWLRQTNANVLIEGHADEQGTREYNLALGARRAASVRDYLVSQGIAQSRLSVVTYGKERPLAVCSDESCWSRNRRAVTVVQ